MRTGWSAVDGIDVDDRASHRDLAAGFDLVFAAVAERDEPGDELVAVELRAGRDRDRVDVLDVRTEALHQRADRRDDDRGQVVAAGAEPPDDPEATAHRLGGGRHALERQRLPRREQLDVGRHPGTVRGRPRAARPRRPSAPRAGPGDGRWCAPASPRRAPAPARGPRPGAPDRRSRRPRPGRRPAATRAIPAEDSWTQATRQPRYRPFGHLQPFGRRQLSKRWGCISRAATTRQMSGASRAAARAGRERGRLVERS